MTRSLVLISVGLLLKEAPEPISMFYCSGDECRAVFYNVHEYKKHRLEIHDEVHEYFLEPAQDVYHEYLKETSHYNSYLTKQWMKKEESQGLMVAPLEFPHRPIQRYGATIKQLENRRMKHTCHCGKKFKWPRRSYCSDECYNDWNFKITSYWGGHKEHFLDQQKRKQAENSWTFIYNCDKCNVETKCPDVDHIIAIVLGGHPWDYRNLQLLCSDCHKIKTKSDIGILAWWKRQVKYDIGPIIPNSQLTLEDCCT